MTRQFVDLTVDALDALPNPCRRCVFWEVADAARGDGGDAARTAKEAWVQSTVIEWGPPGSLLRVNGATAAWAMLAPPAFVGRVQRLPAPPSPDALLLATLWVRPDLRTSGLARQLLQHTLRLTQERGARALEAYGGRGVMATGTCVVPEGFLLASGFRLLRDDDRLPLLRLDMRQTVRWQEEVTGVVQRVRRALRSRRGLPVPSPAPPGAASAALAETRPPAGGRQPI